MTIGKKADKVCPDRTSSYEFEKTAEEEQATRKLDLYGSSRLEEWLSSETMSEEEGLYLLAGLDPAKVETLQEDLIGPARLVNALPLDRDSSFLGAPYEKRDKNSFHGNEEAYKSFHGAWEQKHLILQQHNDLFHTLERKLKQSVTGLGEPAIKRGIVHYYSPSRFMEWASSIKFKPQWFDWATNKGLLVFQKNQTPQDPDKPLSTTERNTLLKLVIGMAMKGYKHDPAAAKSKAPKEIADDLAELEINISDDTVRKYLKEAANTVLPRKPRQS